MAYKVDYSAMQELLGSYNGAVEKWNAGLSSVIQKELAIEASTNISGNRASNMKQYLATAYSCAKDSLVMLLELFRQNYLLYTEAYYQQIDPAGDAHIESGELSRLRGSIQAQRGLFQQIGLSAESAAGKVSDLVSFPSLDIGEQDTKFGNLLTSLDNLDSDINALESAHVSADFTDIDAMISKLDAYLHELIGQNKEFKTGFSSGSFIALASVPGLISTMHEAYDQLSAQESNVAIAAQNLEKRLEQEQAELEKRKQQAEWAKIGVYAVVGLISAVTIAVAPAASPVVIGMASGLVTSVFSASADEYVKHGMDTAKWDKGRIGIYAIIGTTTGAIGGAVPSGASVAVKAGIKGMSSALEGATTAGYDQFIAHGQITDVSSIAGDALLKGGSTFVGSAIGSVVSDNVTNFVKQNDTIKDLSEHVVGGVQHFGASLQVEGASELASGAVKRFSSTAVKETGGFVASIVAGKSISEAYAENSIVSKSFESAADIKSIVGDTASAVTSAATDDPLLASEKKLDRRSDDYYLFGDSPDLSGKKDAWKDWNSEEYDRMMEKLAKMDERGDDARDYELFGDSRSFAAQRNSAIKEAWEQERRLVMQGRGTRDWTVSQQEELIRTGKVSGFDGSHMLDASSNPSVANDPNNIQFFTYEEHIFGAHSGNPKNQTTGWYDTTTGETTPINPRKIPHREETSFELSQKFDYTQMDLADQLGSAFGYGRGKK